MKFRLFLTILVFICQSYTHAALPTVQESQVKSCYLRFPVLLIALTSTNESEFKKTDDFAHSEPSAYTECKNTIIEFAKATESKEDVEFLESRLKNLKK